MMLMQACMRHHLRLTIINSLFHKLWCVVMQAAPSPAKASEPKQVADPLSYTAREYSVASRETLSSMDVHLSPSVEQRNPGSRTSAAHMQPDQVHAASSAQSQLQHSSPVLGVPAPVIQQGTPQAFNGSRTPVRTPLPSRSTLHYAATIQPQFGESTASNRLAHSGLRPIHMPSPLQPAGCAAAAVTPMNAAEDGTHPAAPQAPHANGPMPLLTPVKIHPHAGRDQPQSPAPGNAQGEPSHGAQAHAKSGRSRRQAGGSPWWAHSQSQSSRSQGDWLSRKRGGPAAAPAGPETQGGPIGAAQSDASGSQHDQARRLPATDQVPGATGGTPTHAGCAQQASQKEQWVVQQWVVQQRVANGVAECYRPPEVSRKQPLPVAVAESSLPTGGAQAIPKGRGAVEANPSATDASTQTLSTQSLGTQPLLWPGTPPAADAEVEGPAHMHARRRKKQERKAAQQQRQQQHAAAGAGPQADATAAVPKATAADNAGTGTAPLQASKPPKAKKKQGRKMDGKPAPSQAEQEACSKEPQLPSQNGSLPEPDLAASHAEEQDVRPALITAINSKGNSTIQGPGPAGSHAARSVPSAGESASSEAGKTAKAALFTWSNISGSGGRGSRGGAGVWIRAGTVRGPIMSGRSIIPGERTVFWMHCGHRRGAPTTEPDPERGGHDSPDTAAEGCGFVRLNGQRCM